MGFKVSLHRSGSTLFWDHDFRDHLHEGTKFGEATITKETCELSVELKGEDEVAWWKKSLTFLQGQKQLYRPIPDAP